MSGAGREPAAALPIAAVLPQLLAVLSAGSAAVLVAPPGAGKTTGVPLALLDAPWRGDGRILVLEPRRIAARAAARRMAELLGEAVGARVGYRVRMEARVSADTRIEVVTQGVFVRMVVEDPSLDGVAAVLFDEAHERSLDGDLGLALAIEAQGAFAPALRLMAMSATLDGARFAALLGGAPVVESAGRAFPVETRYVPRAPETRVEDAVAAAVLGALAGERGSVLAFLPGQAEIRRTAERLESRLADDVDLFCLHGGLGPGEQDRAIRPSPPGRRKVVLATAIAETSITIEGVRVVVDGGLSRRPVHDAATGLSTLETVRVSRAAADQRRGRAGRTAPGVCIRLWPEAQTAALAPEERPEILAADLTAFALDVAAAGITDPAGLALLDPPPAAAWRAARELLADLGALDAAGRLTGDGAALRRLPLHPRLAHMVRRAAADGRAGLAAEIAAILSERGLGGDAVDLGERVRRFRRDRGGRAEEGRRFAAALLRSIAAPPGEAGEGAAGAVLAQAYPDRIAAGRGGPGRFVLANGRGGVLDPAEALAREPFLVVAELAGSAEAARILAAAPIARAEIERAFADRIEEVREVFFDRAARAVRARRRRRLGRVVLAEENLAATPEEATPVLLAGLAEIGLDALPWTAGLERRRARLAFLRARLGDPWPDVSEAALVAGLADWLGPFVPGRLRLDAVTAADLDAALAGLVPPGRDGELDRLAPSRLVTPGGREVAIDYRPEGPVAAVRVQDLFGLDRHPVVAGAVPVVLELLSPADRPIQVTADLPRFWRGSWAAVRADLRGRYPKHAWPEDPITAPPVRMNPNRRSG